MRGEHRLGDVAGFHTGGLTRYRTSYGPGNSRQPSRSGGAGEPAGVEVGEAAATGEQVVGRSGLHHVAVLDDGDLVGLDHRGQPVGDQHRGAALPEAAKGLLDSCLGDHVEVGGGLVEHQQGGVGDPGARERDQLALAGGDQDAALADLGVEAVGEAGDDRFGADRARGCLDLGAAGVGAAETDVVLDRTREQNPF
jgi:hypothetical protein